VFSALPGHIQTSDVPFTIDDADSNASLLAGLYAEDEWSVAPALTINYGARYDVSQGFKDGSQLSPRINAVYQLDDAPTFHLGYARFFTPPGLEYISAGNVARFAGTTNAPTVYTDDPPYPERANYFDTGVLWKACRSSRCGQR
jgi:outer membrane receptor for ferrienterochelin and colicin